MSAWVSLASRAAEGGGFTPPGTKEFDFPGIGGTFVTRPLVIMVLGAIVVGAFFYLATRRASIVPGKLQFAGEQAYGFVRNSIALDAIGKPGLKYVPYLATVFFFIATLNIAGIIPFIQVPATSKIALPLVLAIISWAIFNAIGIKRDGFFGYFKAMMFPPGVPWPIYFLLAPIEFLSTFSVRPITLPLRLTLHRVAGHLVLVLFIVGGEYLVVDYGGVVGIASGTISLLGSIVLTFFEGFIQLLQAYVFTLLSALYIAGALVDEH